MDNERRIVGSDRVLASLNQLGKHPNGISLDGLSRVIGAAKPTVHRASATLRRRGLVSQDGYGSYLLRDGFLRIAFTFHEARPEHLRAQPIRQHLSDRFGETAHYSHLEGRDAVDRSKVDRATGPMKLTSVVGRRNPAHATGGAKLLLAFALPDVESIKQWIGSVPLIAATQNTITSAQELHAAFNEIREQGFAVDDQENEAGINCIAVPVFFSSPAHPSCAISLSTLAHRTPLRQLGDAVGSIQAASGRPYGHPQGRHTRPHIACPQLFPSN
ncbi:IclR family transcriptional regulator [Arthrobacter sp. SLBN-100]|uniref:IclR family transcriptional regulator n=1 Tax=Arthrobacter sp. SLBN-100 TaxID=2768450 RepID=UPI001154EF58|nr:IclR family transcriptional regulator [Arthrobacter sp. SLBN-100]TQJ66257.1 IclR family transcriptional regulator [Arthrobacter sp. SLBN-100]